MLKQTLLLLVALISLNAIAQEGTASPYSFYGIGELKFRGTVENKSMGGLSVYSDSIHLNLLNPASLGKLKLTTFTIGGNHKSSKLQTNTNSAKVVTTTFDYMAVGLPMGKLGMSFGLVPYTSVGYKTGFSDHLTATAGDGRYEGTGGINKAFIAAGYSINNHLSLGIDINYNFGKIHNEAIIITDLQYDTQEINESKLSGLAVNFGATYKKRINEKLELMTGLTYSPGVSLSSNNTREISTIAFNSNGIAIPRDTKETNLKTLGLENTKFKLPSKLTIGAGLGKPKKWFAGIDYTNLGTGKLGNLTFNNTSVTYKNANKITAGGFYIPKHNSLTSYLSRIVYRTGVRFENTGITIQNEDINEFGISFGVGLPVGRKFSNVNIGFEYGSRGTTNNNLVKENFFNLNLSLSFNDKWFQKRKID
ncbi:MAG: hypothetical protein HRT69_05945 [Flavobacteriaceae bacterium]|nr:hypothetical protein [Flavobacteriaceae bacterium]